MNQAEIPGGTTVSREQLLRAVSLMAALLAAAASSAAAAQEAPPAPAQEPSPSAAGGGSVEEHLDAQAKELEQLRAMVEKLQNAGASHPPAPCVLARVPGLVLTGFVQGDWMTRDSSIDQLDPSSGEPLNEDRVVLRRARLRAELERRWAASAVELDGNTVKGVQARVVAAEATLRLPPPEGGITPLALTAGLFKIPFGFEVPQSDRDRLFVERSAMSRALFPGEYDVGARASGGWSFLRWAAALQNGNPVGDKTFPGRDPNAAKDLLVRGGVDLASGPVRIVSGASYLKGTGFHRGSSATKDTFQWRDANENGVIDAGEIQVVPGRPATPSSNFERDAFGADARVVVMAWPRLGKTELGGELMIATNLDRSLVPADPVSRGRDLRELGWYVLATQELGPHLQVGARYDRYDPDRDATDSRVGTVVPSDASFSTVAIAFAARVQGGRVVAEYDRNRNHLGRDAAGVPMNLKDDAVVVRVEVSF